MRRWKAEREDGKQSAKMDALLPTRLYIYIYVHLFNLRHTPPAIERGASSGGIMGRFPSCPWHCRLSVPGQRCYFLDLGKVGMEREGPPTDIAAGLLI